MKSFLKVVLYAAIGVVVFVGACYIRGMYLPAHSTIEASTTVMAPPPRVWSTLTNSALLPQWRQSITSVSPLAEQNGDPCIDAVSGAEHTTLCEHVQTPGKSVLFHISSKSFNGTWLVELAPIQHTATHVTITQDGAFTNPWYRFLGYQFGLDSEIRSVESDLKSYVEKSDRATPAQP